MIADALKAWASAYLVTRATDNGFTPSGVTAAPSTSTLTIQAVVVPLTGRELERLPEGLRTQEIQAVFTTTQLQSAAAGQRPDEIAVGLESWQVEHVESWIAGAFYRAIVRRL